MKANVMNEPVNFEKHIKNAYSWLDEIARTAGTPDRTDWAYNALKSVLHTIRDRTTVEEVFHLSAQLPLFIREFTSRDTNLQINRRK